MIEQLMRNHGNIDRDGPRSNPYHLNPAKACEACCFGSRYLHSDWCERLFRPSDWICEACASKDARFENSELVLESGACERCPADDTRLFRVKGLFHGV